MEVLKPEIAIVREASEGDILKIRTMHAHSWLVAYPNDEFGVSKDWVRERVSAWTTEEGIQKSKEHFKGIFGNPQHFYRIAELGDEVVGLVHAINEGEKQHLAALYIDESQYGNGLAQRLMDGAIEWLDSTKPTDLGVVVYNARAIRFYEKYGFRVQDGSEHQFAEKIPVVNMILEGENDEV